MRVALSFPGCHRRGGVERITFECARFLSGRGHEVHVLASEWEADPASRIEYHRIPSRSKPSFLRAPSYFRNCTRHLKTIAFDVLNTHGCVCPTGGVHWVQSLHRAWLDRSRQFRGRFSVAGLKQRLNPLHPTLLRLEREHFGGRNYRKVIATTEDVRRDLNSYYGVPFEDVVVIPNGFSPSEFNPQKRAELREPIRARLGLTPEQHAILFVANELERKGYSTILRALAALGRKDLRLLVVGRPDKRAVLSMAEQHGVAEQVLACGSSSNVAEFHAAADLFVLPTQYEAFCLAILEALGSGLPVVTSNVPGARDAIQAGVNGFLIEDPKSGDELAERLRIALEPANLQRMSGVAAGTVAAYQWPKVLERYESVLLENCK